MRERNLNHGNVQYANDGSVVATRRNTGAYADSKGDLRPSTASREERRGHWRLCDRFREAGGQETQKSRKTKVEGREPADGTLHHEGLEETQQRFGRGETGVGSSLRFHLLFAGSFLRGYFHWWIC